MKKDKNILKKRLKLLFLCSLLTIIIVFLGQKVVFFVHGSFLKVLVPKKVFVDVDFIYSDTLKNNLIKFANFYLENKNLEMFNPSDLSFCLNNKFKIVRKVEWDFVEPSIAKLKIVGTKPFCKINERFVLGDNQNIFDFKLFDGPDSKNMKSVNVALNIFDKKVSSQIYSFFQKVSDKSFFEYDWNYLRDSSINLFPRKNKKEKNKILIVTDNKAFFDLEKFALFDNILDSFKKTISKKRWGKKNGLFDTRFKNRLIVKHINNKTFNFLKKEIFEHKRIKLGKLAAEYTKKEGGG